MEDNADLTEDSKNDAEMVPSNDSDDMEDVKITRNINQDEQMS